MTMTPRDLADLCEHSPGFDAGTLKLLADTIRGQAGEIDDLKADAIVRGSIKLDQAAKYETEIARLKDVVRHAEYWEAVRKEERDAAVAVAEQVRLRLAEATEAWRLAGARLSTERDNLHTRLTLAERVVKAEQATRVVDQGASLTEDLLRIRKARLELNEALAAWEKEDG